jgi:hypothetical protein
MIVERCILGSVPSVQLETMSRDKLVTLSWN